MTKKERRELAEQLSAILKNPNTPVSIYEALADLTIFYSQSLDYDSAEIIEISLEAHELRGDNRQPDITNKDGLSVIC